MAKIIDVCGVKNSGKTTLISRLTELYTSRGMKIAVIKHDGHDFECDIPSTDTRSFIEHGAYGCACFSDKRMFVHRQGTGETEEELMGLFPEADIIFLEGFKNSSFDKIEVIRSGISDHPVSNPAGRFIIATDLPACRFEEKTADINDIAGIAEMIDMIGGTE